MLKIEIGFSTQRDKNGAVYERDFLNLSLRLIKLEAARILSHCALYRCEAAYLGDAGLVLEDRAMLSATLDNVHVEDARENYGMLIEVTDFIKKQLNQDNVMVRSYHVDLQEF